MEAPSLPGVGPIALGGFRFDPAARPGAEWRGYGDGFVILPSLCYTKTEDGFWQTENTILHPNGHQRPPVSTTLQNTHASARHDSLFAETEAEGSVRDRWRTSVDRALKLIRNGELEKVVLARRLLIHFPNPFIIEKALRSLITSNPECTIFAFSENGTTFLGATPELLIRTEADQAESVCLAGSAPRGTTPAEDQLLGKTLLKDSKERWEHELAVRAVAESLEGLCSGLRWQEAPQLLKLRNVQHLATIFGGVNAKGAHVLDYVERLHPTPVVAGSPRPRAMSLIRQMEGMDRGWYAGPVGWFDASGKGEFTVAIRSALVRSRDAILYAGAGIVEGSDPDREYAETSLKLRTLLTALDVESP